MAIEPVRIVEVDCADGRVAGSGYLISPSLVLTARHVVEPGMPASRPDAPAGRLTPGWIASQRLSPTCRVRLLCDLDQPLLDAAVVWWHAEADVALLVPTDPRWRTHTELSGTQWADLDEAVEVEAVGFPAAEAETDAVGKVKRDSTEIGGVVRPLSLVKQGRWAVELAKRPRGVSGGSAWAGFSGAGLLSDGLLIGVLVSDPDPGHPDVRELRAVRARSFAADPALLAWITADGGPAAWTRSPATPGQRVRLRGLTHGAAEPTIRLLTGRVTSSHLPPVSGIGADQPALRPGVHIVGRTAELEELHAAFTDRPPAAEPAVRVLYGPAGVGKTMLAAAYAHRYSDEYSLIGWLRAQDEVTLRSDLAGVLADFELAVPEDGSPVQAVHDLLAARSDRWLLVFDNAESQRRVTPTLPRRGDGHILVTSLDPNWTPNSLKAEVQTLGRAAAVTMLRELSGDPDEGAAADLADELGYLPLAVEQAATYVAATEGTLRWYLRLWKTGRSELLGKGAPITHIGTVKVTWEISYQAATAAEPAAAVLLAMASLCASQEIPLELLAGQMPSDRAEGVPERAYARLDTDPLAVEEAIAALRRYSLLHRTGDTITVHRLTQAVCRDHLDPATRLSHLERLTQRARRLIPRHASEPTTWPYFAKLLPHVLALIDHGADPELALRHIDYLGCARDIANARALVDHIGRAAERTHRAEETRLRARSRLIEAEFNVSGDSGNALREGLRLLPDLLRVIGSSHPDTLNTRGNIAEWTGMSGDPAAALALDEALLPDLMRVLGPEDPATLATRHNIAYWTGAAGDIGAALDGFRAVQADQARVLGPDHPDTLTTRGSIALWTATAGDSDAALALNEALLADRTRILGTDHAATLTTRRRIAYLTALAGDPAAARVLFEALLPDQVRILGPDHPATLDTRASIANLTGLAGDPTKARLLYEALLADTVRIFGAGHIATRTARRNVARWSAEAGGAGGG
jgi:hypothetical protein